MRQAFVQAYPHRYLVHEAQMPQARDIETDDFFALGFGQTRQQNQPRLAQAQRHFAANISGVRAHGKGPVDAVQADRVKTMTHQQEDGVIEHAR